jgi:choline dehydrogenase
MLSGIGSKKQLESAGIACALDSPEVGKHLKDHIQVPLFFHSCQSGVSVSDVGLSMGPAALRLPLGPLPADPVDDACMPPELQALKEEAERRLAEWATTGNGLAASSLYDAAAWYSTGLGDVHSHDAQISCLPCGFTQELWRELIHVDVSQYLGDSSPCLSRWPRTSLFARIRYSRKVKVKCGFRAPIQQFTRTSA